eukprot:scaffold85099_cov60-Phaeocystis_antarctica.AAC.1
MAILTMARLALTKPLDCLRVCLRRLGTTRMQPLNLGLGLGLGLGLELKVRLGLGLRVGVVLDAATQPARAARWWPCEPG